LPLFGQILVIAALDSELSLLKSELKALPVGQVAGQTYLRGNIGDLTVLLSAVRVGVVSAALTLGGLIAGLPVGSVIMCGSAGAFDNSGLKIGDVAVASAEILAELGLCQGPGYGSGTALGLDGLDQEIALDREITEALVQAAADVAQARVVKSLTVVGVSADVSQGRTRADRFAAGMENMEGYAAAVAGIRWGIPVGEVRGISNQVGNRDKTTWDLASASELAQAAVLNYLHRLAET